MADTHDTPLTWYRWWWTAPTRLRAWLREVYGLWTWLRASVRATTRPP